MKRSILIVAAAATAMLLSVSIAFAPATFRRDGAGRVRFNPQPFQGPRLTLLPEAHAARNGSGTFTLYSPGNPVTTATIITSSWANNTLSDMATEVTDSLSRSGKGGMLASLRGVNGTVGSPTYSWTSETNSGPYRAAANDIRFAINGTDVQFWAAGYSKIAGTGQATASPSTSTGLGGSLLLQDTGSSANDGGMTLFGSSQGYWAAIKGLLVDGTTNTKGDLIIATRRAIADATLTESLRVAADGSSTFAGNAKLSGATPTISATASDTGLTIKGNAGASGTTVDLTLGSTLTRTNGHLIEIKNNTVINSYFDYLARLVMNDISGTAQIVVDPASGGSITFNGSGSFISGIQTLGIAATVQASLGTPSNGTFKYCSDCTIANPCAGGGTGALAKRLNGAWVCN